MIYRLAGVEEETKTSQIPKNFDSQTQEARIYKIWEDSGVFSPEGSEAEIIKQGIEPGKPFVMTLPPPNANGDLHVGHTCGYSFQDAMGRYYRMHGRPTLLLPGKDHASIQTEAVYIRHLEEKGIDKWELGREKFYKMCYDFCIERANDARSQEKKIGLSADWNRELFTLDERLNTVIYDTFFKMYDDGLIYRGKYIINQCPHCRTALADIDTVHEKSRGILAEIIYPFVDEADQKVAERDFAANPINIKDDHGKVIDTKILSLKGITVATTRPETMLGDTAIAVHPDDPKYKNLIGKKVRIPIVDREIPIIADQEVDMQFGTAAVKVTPAHSPVDFEIGKRHDLPVINVIDELGRITAPAPDKYIGMDTVECSKALVKDLEELSLLVDIKNYKHEIVQCERCDTPIQHIVSYQWFVDVEPLAKKALAVLKNGGTKIIPDGQQSALIHFFENIEPWCISRQLWWGQDIPVWYSGGKELHDWLLEEVEKSGLGKGVSELSEKERSDLIAKFEDEMGKKVTGTGNIFVQKDKPENDPDWDGGPSELLFEKESDILDTWFSSGQWPFSTLGGPGGDDYSKYYPTDVLETARDILFWWVARMMMLGIYRTGKTPFHTVYLHGMILAEDGKKMSKSRGNGVSPMEVIRTYGADALRLWYYSDTLPGANSPLRTEKIKGNRNFVNKIWNAFRFVIMNVQDSELEQLREKLEEISTEMNAMSDGIDAEKGEEYQKEHMYSMITKTNIQQIDGYVEEYRFNLAAEEIREFFWHTICDKWIEEVKNKIQDLKPGDSTRIRVLASLIHPMMQYLKAMHPFIPFITEAVWQELVKLGLADGDLIIQVSN
ncbi:valine--tRNA ligase [Candidatus Dojkabacteria bacterium]|nr:valine--tRNA ligase [Candidatus Dojkabacteria bacterium]